MKYLLDTCTISDFYNGCKKTARRIKYLASNDIAVSIITVAEVEYGIVRIKGSKKAEEIAKLSEELFSKIEVISLDYVMAKTIGNIKNELIRNGEMIGAYDLLIGATAKYYDLILVTSNVSEFVRIEGLRIENWRK